MFYASLSICPIGDVRKVELLGVLLMAKGAANFTFVVLPECPGEYRASTPRLSASPLSRFLIRRMSGHEIPHCDFACSGSTTH